MDGPELVPLEDPFERLALTRGARRFVDRNVEAEYRAWSVQDRLPAIRAAAWVALVVWVTFTPIFAVGFGDDAPPVWPVFTIMVPAIIAGTLLISVPGLRRVVLPVVMPVASLVLSLSGFMTAWYGDSIGDAGSGGPAAGVMMAILYAPFMRIPAAWSLAALVPPYVYMVSRVVDQAGGVGAMGAADTWFCLFPFSALLTVVAVNFLADLRDRTGYRDKRIIELQKAQLELAQGQIRRYLPVAVAEQIVTGNEASIAEPKRQRVTVVFSDIAGFTDMADRVEPEVMTEVLSDYMSTMAGLIEKHGGTVNEFAGDGLMALFGAPEVMPADDQVRRAVGAALAMQAAMPRLNDAWRKLGLGVELKTRIGINTGMVSVGSYGSEGRMTYTAIGLQTNIASRVESAATPGEVLITDASYQLVSDEIVCIERGEVECKGVHYPVKVYAPNPVPTAVA